MYGGYYKRFILNPAIGGHVHRNNAINYVFYKRFVTIMEETPPTPPTIRKCRLRRLRDGRPPGTYYFTVRRNRERFESYGNTNNNTKLTILIKLIQSRTPFKMYTPVEVILLRYPPYCYNKIHFRTVVFFFFLLSIDRPSIGKICFSSVCIGENSILQSSNTNCIGTTRFACRRKLIFF